MTIHHQIAIRAPRSAVYRAIAEPAQIGRWWGAQTPVPTPEGLVLEHQAGPYGTVRLRVVDLQPDARIEWACIGDYASRYQLSSTNRSFSPSGVSPCAAAPAPISLSVCCKRLADGVASVNVSRLPNGSLTVMSRPHGCASTPGRAWRYALASSAC